MKHLEQHRSERIGWLRAAVLGANDGILSVGSILVGVASANPDHPSILLAGVAGLTAGALSMAAGEALTSAAAFGVGGALPVLVSLVSPTLWTAWTVAGATVAGLVMLGILSAWAGGSSIWKGALRVTFWGVVAIVVTALVGWLFGVAVA
jgi:VIT1/CCC1 family predicted Fe2+/Mn2+ transporter